MLRSPIFATNSRNDVSYTRTTVTTLAWPVTLAVPYERAAVRCELPGRLGIGSAPHDELEEESETNTA